MRTESIELIKLIASDGCVLTNGEAYGKAVYLGCNDKAENWREITDTEYNEILKQQEKLIEQQAEGV